MYYNFVILLYHNKTFFKILVEILSEVNIVIIYVNDFKKDNISDTQAINDAIKYCNQNGGGTIYFSANCTYRAGMIRLLDNVELYFESNAILKASDNILDFSEDKNLNIQSISAPTFENCDYNGQPDKFFIYANNAKNIKISGCGIIDGNEEIFYGKVSKWHIDGFFYPRVPLIYFENCENVCISDITLQRSAFWTTHLVGCRNVIINNIKILNNLKLANCDGIDPDHCQNVVIKNCYIEAADDCIVFKTTSIGKAYGECRDIEVSGCTLISTSAAIKFGTESVSDFKNIYIHDCNILKSNRGIAFMLRDEGSISNIRFENINIDTRRFSHIYWWGKGEPICITAVKRIKDGKLGNIKDIYFKNIKMDCESPIFIYGYDDSKISNIKFVDLKMNLINKTNYQKDIYDLRPCEEYQIVTMPMSIIKIFNANNIEFDNFSYSVDENIKSYIQKEFDINNSKNINLK